MREINVMPVVKSRIIRCGCSFTIPLNNNYKTELFIRSPKRFDTNPDQTHPHRKDEVSELQSVEQSALSEVYRKMKHLDVLQICTLSTIRYFTSTKFNN